MDETRKESIQVGLDLVKLVADGVGDIPFVPVINKCDLDWEVTDEEISEALSGVEWFKSSAKTGENVDLAFETLFTCHFLQVTFYRSIMVSA